MAAARHAGGAVHGVFHSGGAVSGRRPPAGRPGRFAAVHAVQFSGGSCRCRLRRGHQPVSARVAGRRHGTAGQCLGVFCHLVGFPALHHGHGHLCRHAALHRRCPDPRPDQRVHLRAGHHLQLFPHQPHPGNDGVRSKPHGLGSGLGRAGRGAGHSPCQRRGRHAGAGRSAAAGRPAVHPQARLVAHYPRLPA